MADKSQSTCNTCFIITCSSEIVYYVTRIVSYCRISVKFTKASEANIIRILRSPWSSKSASYCKKSDEESNRVFSKPIILSPIPIEDVEIKSSVSI